MLSSCSLSNASSKLTSSLIISSSRIPLSKSVFFELSSIDDCSLELFLRFLSTSFFFFYFHFMSNNFTPTTRAYNWTFIKIIKLSSTWTSSFCTPLRLSHISISIKKKIKKRDLTYFFKSVKGFFKFYVIYNF